jgi:hypothetical protein
MAYSRKKDPRESKAFKYFKKIIEISVKSDTLIPEPKLFIRAQFEILKLNKDLKKHEELCPPHRLLKSECWKRYKNYINQKNSDNIYKKTVIKLKNSDIINELDNTKKFFTNFCLEYYGTTEISYDRIFSKDSKIWIWICHGFISCYFLTLSKTYMLYKINIDKELQKELPYNLDIYLDDVNSRAEVIEYARKLFGKEINIG